MKYTGKIEKILYSGNDWFVFLLRTPSCAACVKCTGIVKIRIAEGDMIEVEGTHKKHYKYGASLAIERIAVTEMSENSLTVAEVDNYVAFFTGITAGVGVATAKKIVKKFGARSVDIAKNAPAEFYRTGVTSVRIAENIHNAVNAPRKSMENNSPQISNDRRCGKEVV